MKRMLMICLAGCALLVALAGTAGAVGLRDVIRTLESPFQASTAEEERIYDYSAEFFQESQIASLNRMQRASGRVAVAFEYQDRGQVPLVRFRWEYEAPTTQEIVSDGETLWVYLPENNQVIQSQIEMVSKARENDPMTFLTGLGNLSRDFLITWAEPNEDIEGNYVLDLRPRRVSSLINRLVIVVDREAVAANLAASKPAEDNPPMPPIPKPGDFPEFGGFGSEYDDVWFPILSSTVYDPNGNSTIIEFSNIHVNTGLSPMTFDFIMPAGVQVVRPTGKEMGF